MIDPVRSRDSIEENAEALLQQTFAECEGAAERLKELLRLADALISVLPPSRRSSYIDILDRFNSVARSGGKDAINDNIIEFAKGKEAVTISEVRDALVEQGLTVDQKRIANSLDYLTRRGQFERIGRGQYRVNLPADAPIEAMLTNQYGPPTFRGHRASEGNPDTGYE